jgi:phage terminase large subunit GpA-like protein
MYSPWVSWGQIAHEYVMHSCSPPPKWWRERLGLATRVVGRSIELEAMRAHCVSLEMGGYLRGVVPPGCLALYAAMDVQADRVYYLVRGFGELGRRSWLIDYGVLPAKMGEPGSLLRVAEAIRRRRYPMAGGHELYGLDGLREVETGEDGRERWRATMPVMDLAIDSGYRTDEVYAVCGEIGATPVKGMSETTRSAEFYKMSVVSRTPGTGKKAQGWSGADVIRLLEVNGGLYKGLIYARMAAEAPRGPGQLTHDDGADRWYWPAYTADRVLGGGGGQRLRGDNHDDYLLQLTSEHQVLETDKHGRVRAMWRLKPGRRTEGNHMLDCEVYVQAIAAHDGVQQLLTGEQAREIYAG